MAHRSRWGHSLHVTVEAIGIPITLNAADAICDVPRTLNLDPPVS